jgi:hypothetical protein
MAIAPKAQAKDGINKAIIESKIIFFLILYFSCWILNTIIYALSIFLVTDAFTNIFSVCTVKNKLVKNSTRID